MSLQLSLTFLPQGNRFTVLVRNVPPGTPVEPFLKVARCGVHCERNEVHISRLRQTCLDIG